MDLNSIEFCHDEDNEGSWGDGSSVAHACSCECQVSWQVTIMMNDDFVWCGNE